MHPVAEKSQPTAAGLRQPWPAVIIVAAGVAAYANSLHAPFLFDDFSSIQDNPTIRQLWPLSGPLSPPVGSGVDGRPLVNLSFALNHAVGGFEVLGYHLANLAIHLLAALALFGVVRRTLAGAALREKFGATSGWLALAVALGWMLHPLQTESVTCVMQRTESLMGLLFLATFYAFIRSAEHPASRWWPVAAVAACLLGMATKEVMVTAPLLVFLFDRTFFAGSFAAAWKKRRGLHLALTATMLVVFWLAWKSGASRGNGVVAGATVTSWDYLMTQAKALVLYARLTLWPHPLVVDYGTGVVKNLGEVILPGLAVVTALSLTGYALWRRPMAGFLSAWFFVILAPSSSVVPLATQTMAEHRMYLPLAAVAVAFALVMSRLGGRAVAIAGVALIALYGGLTALRNHDYRTPVAIWEQTVRYQPGNERAHNNLGQALYQAGRFQEAIPELETALAIQPSLEVHGLLSLTLAALDRPQEALVHSREAVRLNPNSGAARSSLGRVLSDLGLFDEAARQLYEAARLAPDLADVRVTLGLVLARLGRLADATVQLQAALKMEPDNPEAHCNLGSVFFQMRNLDEAARYYERAVQLNPAYAEAFYNLGLTRAEQGRPADAVRPLQRALEIQPALQPARDLLASLQAPGGTKK